MSDQAPEFSGKVIAALCDLLGVAKICTSPYHPQSNGAVERAHQTQMIGKLDPEKRCKWKSHLGSVLIAYNTARSLIMGYSPYFLMFWRRPCLPIDLLFSTAMWQGSTRTIDDYVLSLYKRLKEALPIARDSAIMEAQQQKRHYDWKARAVELQPGDKVLVKLDAFCGQRWKLKNRWSSDLHMVVKHVADVIKDDKTGKKQVLHHAWLLLWLAEYDSKPIWVNHIMISVSLPGMDLETQLHGSDWQNAVPRRLIYGLNWPTLKSMYESSNLTTDNVVWELLTGAPQNGTGHRIPDKRKKKRHLLRCRTNSEDVPVCWAAPCDVYLVLHPNGGTGTGRASHYHCWHQCLHSCANSNKFEQTACGCHHKVLAK